MPYLAGRFMLVECSMRMDLLVGGIGDLVGFAEVAVQRESLQVVVDGLIVVAGVVIDVANAVSGDGHAGGAGVAAQPRERGPAVAAGLVVVAEPG